MAFKPGNMLGQRKGTKPYFSAAIKRHLAQNPNDLKALVKALFKKAKDGDVGAAAFLTDRIEGKAVARSEVTGANGAALFPVTAITVTGVEPAAIVAGELERIADAEPASD